MQFVKEPLSFEQIMMEHEVVGWIDGYAIVENEYGSLLYTEMPQEFVVMGSVLPNADLMPIESLPPEIEKKIREYIRRDWGDKHGISV